MKVVIVRVLEIDYEDSTYTYRQLEANEQYGPFPSLQALVAHIHDRMFEQIAASIARQLN